MAVADRGGQHRDARLAQSFVEPEVAHHRACHRRPPEFPFFHQGQRAQGEDAVTRNSGPGLVGEDHPVGVAIERYPEISPLLHHDPAGMLGVQGTTSVVDIQPVGIHAKFYHFRAEFLEDERRQQVRRAMTAIHHDFHSP